jgi:diguanylate cyclase (GGDEF)-like protein/PAS domain S-box-containing protein
MMGASAFLSLVGSLGSLAVFMLGHVFLSSRLADRPIARETAGGILLGLGAAAAMLAPVHLATGIFIDARNVFPALAAPFGGPWAMVLASTIPASVRLLEGGDGALAGAAGPVLAGLLGDLMWRLLCRRRGLPSVQQMAVIALVAGCLPMVSFLLIADGSMAVALFLSHGPVLAFVDTVGILLLGLGLRFGQMRNAQIAEMSRTEAMLSAMFKYSEDAKFIAKLEGPGIFRLVAANDLALASIGKSREQAVGKLMNEYLSGERLARVARIHMEVVADMKMTRWEDTVEIDGETRHFEATFVPVAGKGSVPTMIYATRRDVTLQKEGERARELAATTDVLTGLRNRRFAEEQLKIAFDQARQNGKPLSALILDIDHFKKINDTYGHNAGDRVLLQIAQVLQRQGRTTDIVARWGGEEFVIIAPHTDSAGALMAANRICDAVRHEVVMVRGQTIPVTVSIGTAQMLGHASPLELMEAADEALYRAKNSGRDRAMSPVHLAAADGERTAARIRFESGRES